MANDKHYVIKTTQNEIRELRWHIVAPNAREALSSFKEGGGYGAAYTWDHEDIVKAGYTACVLGVEEVEDYEPPALHLKDPSQSMTDYVLHQEQDSCWVEVGGVSVYIHRIKDYAVGVSLHPNGKEYGDLGGCSAVFPELKGESE